MSVAGTIPDAKGHAKAFTVHIGSQGQGRDLVSRSLSISPIFASTAQSEVALPVQSATLTVGNVAAAAMRLPSLIEELRRDLAVFGFVIAAIGALSLLLVANSWRRKRAARLQFAFPSGQYVPTASPVSATSEVAAPAARYPQCTCSAPISARSRTGRCRRCARTIRAQRPYFPDAEMPSTLVAATIVDLDEDAVESTRAVLTHSLGSARAKSTMSSERNDCAAKSLTF